MDNVSAFLTHQRQYAAIGQFVSSFEWCCWKLRHYSCAILQAKGLTDFSLAEVVFNQRVFTAEPLFSCFASMAAQSSGQDEALIKQLDALRRRFSMLVKARNDLLHGTYMLGIHENGEPTEMLIEKYTPDKFGARIIEVISSEEKMANLLREAEEIKSEISSVFTTVWTLIRPKSSA